MKKFLAIIMAVLMLASVAVTAVSAAEDTINYEEFYNENGIDGNIYVGAPVTTAPVLDGVISEGEYTASLVTLKDGPYAASLESDVTEYFAHDADYIYYAAVYKRTATYKAFNLQYKVMNSTEYPKTVGGYYDRGNIYFRMTLDETAEKGYVMDFEKNVNNGYTDRISGATVDAFAWNENLWVETSWDLDTMFKTVELKMAKSYFADALGIENDELRVVQYFLYLHDMGAYINVPASGGLRDLFNAAGAVKIESMAYRNMILEEAPAVEEPEPTNWKAVNEKFGFNVSVPYTTTPPVFDGVVSEGEYPATKTTAKSDIHTPASTEIGNADIVEYFAHDADYVYYALTFEQAALNRAGWLQFKLNNTFDVYNSDLFNRVTYQSRYTEDASGNNASYVNGTGAQSASYPAPSNDANGPEVSFKATLDKTTSMKTYEFKISKEYVAGFTGIDKADVAVIPYFVSFHAACTLGSVINEDIRAELTALGATKVPKDSEAAYLFMVLEDYVVENNIKSETQATASVRISEQNPGLRFKSTVNTGDLNLLVNKYGAENVKVGTLIAPADKVGAKALTHSFGTAGVDYLDVVADVANPFGTDGENTVFAGSVANIKAKNLDRDFAAVGYIAYNDGENWNYIYSESVAEKNVSDVAYAAYTDIAFEEADGYTNEIVGAGDTLKGAYSPYTEVQRTVLKALIVEKSAADNYAADIFVK